ncbi:MAG: hypothetical protein ACRENB_11795 [Gemmatimonadales bacterium]
MRPATCPCHGDVYRFVPGVDPRYATVGLRAAGVPPGAAVRWYVDGKPAPGGRMPLRPGRHRIRLEVGRDVREAAITVAP